MVFAMMACSSASRPRRRPGRARRRPGQPRRGGGGAGRAGRTVAPSHPGAARFTLPVTAGGEGGVAGDRAGGVAVQPGRALAAGHRGGGTVPSPLGADLGRPLLQQRGAAVHQEQVGQGDVHQRCWVRPRKRELL